MSKVSVIMPVKNTGDKVLYAAKSILNQTHENLELVIIDDHSTDDSLEVLESIDDPRLIVLSNPGHGISSALNFGIKSCTGDFIARMDADDVSHESRIEAQLMFAIANPQYDVISCLVNHCTYEASTSSTGGYEHYVNWTNQIITPGDHYNNKFVDAPLAHPSILCKKSVFLDYGYYSEEKLPEDFELWLRWMDQGVRFAKYPIVLYDWYDYPSRTSRNSDNYSTAKFFELKAKYFKYWLDRNQQDRIWVWGYGKDVFKKSEYLANNEVMIEGYVDIKERPHASRKVIPFTEVKKTTEDFYLIYVSDRTGKENIKKFLNERGMIAGQHYFFMA